MSSARDNILRRISQTLDKSSSAIQRQQQVDERLRSHPRGPQRHLPEDLVELFTSKLQAVSASMVEVTQRRDVAGAVMEYITQQQLEQQLVCAPISSMKIEWPDEIDVRYGIATDNDKLAVTEAYCAIAETGTLVLPSSPDRPTTLNFLPDYFICILSEKDILPDMESVWEKYRKENDEMPRVFNLVTGPSRTADVEQTIQLGAHGPRQLHVVLIKGQGTSDE